MFDKLKFVTALFFILYSFSIAQVESKIHLKGMRITDIKENNNSIWIATYGHGLYEYSLKDGKLINYSSENSNLENDLFHCVAASKDFIWAGASEGLFIYSKKTKKWTKRKFAQGGEFGNWIRSLNYDEKKNRLWIGRFRNVTVLDVKANKYVDYNRVINNNEKTNNFNTIAFEGDSAVWFGVESGMHKYSSKNSIDEQTAWQYFINKGRVFNSEGTSVSVSEFIFLKKEIWFGTDEFITKDQPEFNIGGIYVWDRKLKWDRISKSNGLGGNGVYCMARTGNYIWAGVYEFEKNEKVEYSKGLYLINRITKKVSSIDLTEIKLPTSNILALYFDGVNLWIGSTDGLVQLKIGNQLGHISK